MAEESDKGCEYRSIATIQSEERGEKRQREAASAFTRCGTTASRPTHAQLESKDKKRTGEKNMCDI